MSPVKDVDKRIELDQKADAIERLCRERGAAAIITGGNVTPRYIQFILKPGQNTPAARLESLRSEIGDMLKAPARLHYDQALKAYWLEIPRSDPQPISLVNMIKRLPAGKVPACTALFGLADDGAPLLARITSPDVKHIVISGPKDAGKTALTVTIALSLAAQNARRALQLVTIGAGLSALAGVPHLNRDLTGAGLPGLVNLIERRNGNPEPRVIVAIDDLAALGDDDRAALNTIFEHGQDKGVHVIGATRQTVPSGNDRALLIAANPDPIAVGDFVAYTQGTAIKFMAAYATPSEIGDMLSTIGGQR